MTGSIRAGGSWKTANAVKVRVGGAWKNATAAYIRVGGTWKSWLAAVISDAFNRTTSGSLGSADTGQLWSAIRGIWYANGTSAQSDTAASSYPIASVSVGTTDATVRADVVSGTGVAFWVTDANSWWASTSYNATSSYACNCSCGTCRNQDCGCQTYASGSACPPCATYETTCTGYCSYDCYYNDNIPYNSCCDSCGNIYGCSGASDYTINYSYTYSCQACGTCRDSSFGCAVYYSCESCYYCGESCDTCTDYYYYARMLKSVSGTVSTATGDVSLGSQPKYITVSTLGNSITAKAYNSSDTLLGTQTYTPTSPDKGMNVGIIKAPTSYNQGSTVDNFTASL